MERVRHLSLHAATTGPTVSQRRSRRGDAHLVQPPFRFAPGSREKLPPGVAHAFTHVIIGPPSQGRPGVNRSWARQDSNLRSLRRLVYSQERLPLRDSPVLTTEHVIGNRCVWQGWQDSNLRSRCWRPQPLPLGDTPSCFPRKLREEVFDSGQKLSGFVSRRCPADSDELSAVAMTGRPASRHMKVG